MGTLTDTLTGLAPDARRAARAEAWKAIAALDGRTFTPRAGVTITVVSSSLLRNGQGVVVGIRLVLSLVRDGVTVDLGDGIFNFVNPPLAVEAPLTPTQINQLRAVWDAGVPTQTQINTWLTNRGFAPASHTLRAQRDKDGIWQFRLLEEAPLKALREALIDALRGRVA